MNNHTHTHSYPGRVLLKKRNQIENPKKMYDEGMNGFKRREIDAEMRCG